MIPPRTVAHNRIKVEPLARADSSRDLDGEVGYYLGHGWKLRSRTPTEAHLVRGEPVAHGVHVFFTIATVGLWLLVYVPLLILGGEKHKLISIDELGRATSSNRAPRVPKAA